MNKGYKQWLVNDTDGALIFSMPNTGDPYGWYTGYKTYAFWASGAKADKLSVCVKRVIWPPAGGLFLFMALVPALGWNGVILNKPP